MLFRPQSSDREPTHRVIFIFSSVFLALGHLKEQAKQPSTRLIPFNVVLVFLDNAV
jgi:hypothetical protein